ncbi:MAG: sugar ABC transporter permease [Anaerolineaceae bacterium]|nr:sugar ABC transporter permease [Anaerolineaceae bacterium]
MAVLSQRSAKQNATAIHDSRGDRIFSIFNYLFLTVILVLVLYPLIYVLSASFSEPAAVTAGEVVLWPVRPTLIGYEKIFEHPAIMQGFANSVFYAVVGSTVNVVMTMLAAYPLSRKDLPGRRFLTAFFFFPMLFSGGLIPFFLVVRDLGLLNTRWALILPTALSVWNLMIAISFIRTSIPEELLEAAQLDGCNDFQYLLRIILPLSGPIIAVLFLFYGVWHWNQYFYALIFLNTKDLFPLQLIMREILVFNQLDLSMLSDIRQMAIQQGLKEQLKFTVLVVSSLPVMLIYPLVQKYFVTGITLGAVKG